MAKVKVTLGGQYTDKLLIQTDSDHVNIFGWEKVKNQDEYYMEMTPWNLIDLNNESKKLGLSIEYDPIVNTIIEGLRSDYRIYKEADKYRRMPIEEINDIWEEEEFRILFPKIQALDQQKRMVLWLLMVKRGGCFAECGTGKTPIGVLFLGKLLADSLIRKPLIIAPVTLLGDTVWFADLAKFSEFKPINLRDPDDFYDQKGDIAFVNPEKLHHWCFQKTKGADHSYIKDNYFELMKYDAIYYDESSQLKTFASYKTQGFLNIARHAKYIGLASATPAPNKIFQIFSQMKVIGSVLGDNYPAFERRYGKKIKCGPKELYFPVEGAESEIMKRINMVSYFIKQTDCFTLPQRHIIDVEIDLHPEHMKLYQQVEKDYIAAIEGVDEFGTTLTGKAVVEYEFTMRMKLLQILNGFVTMITEVNNKSKKCRVSLEWNAKADKLDEMITEFVKDPKCNMIVWCRFRWEIQTFSKKYKDISTYVYGGMTDSARNEHLTYWKNNPKCRIIFALAKSVKFGHTWLKATKSIYYSATEDYEDFAQSRDRNYRYGLDHEVEEYRFVTNKTVERKVWYAITHRQKLDKFLKNYYKRNLPT